MPWHITPLENLPRILREGLIPAIGPRSADLGEEIAAVHLFSRFDDLVDANWGESEPPPQIVAATIGEEQPATAEAIKSLVDCGAIRTDRSLEDYLRQRYRLPVKDAPTTTQPKEGE